MKLFYTLLILLFSFCAGYTQVVSKPDQNVKDNAVALNPSNQTFSIEKVYPNPVQDQITVNLKSNQPGNIKISLINILGTEVQKWEPSFINAGDQKLKLDLSSFKSGIYILKITKSDQVATQVLKKY